MLQAVRQAGRTLRELVEEAVCGLGIFLLYSGQSRILGARAEAKVLLISGPSYSLEDSRVR